MAKTIVLDGLQLYRLEAVRRVTAQGEEWEGEALFGLFEGDRVEKTLREKVELSAGDIGHLQALFDGIAAGLAARHL